MKIKTKKQLNLPQLIEWAFENNVRNQSFLTYDSEGIASEVHFDIRGLPKFSSMTDKYDLFTVEVEEEITEDTVIPEMLTIYFNGDSHIHNNKRLNDLNTTYHIKSAYIMNDDLRLILIWRDGKLVE